MTRTTAATVTADVAATTTTTTTAAVGRSALARSMLHARNVRLQHFSCSPGLLQSTQWRTRH